MKNTPFIFIFFSLFLTMACNQDPAMTEEETSAAVENLDLSHMDTTAVAADDFFQFVNGGWLQQAEIPADRGSWGSFNELRKATDQKTLDVLKGAMEGDDYAPDSDQAKAAKFYQTAMDTAHLNNVGVQPLLAELEPIAQITDRKSLENYLIESAPIQHNAFFGFRVRADMNNSAVNAAFIGPGELGLPERDYYTKTDEESKDIQAQYQEHVARMLGYLDYSETEAEAAANRIYQLEEQMAEARMNKEQRRNPLNRNNPMSIADLNKKAPVFDWAAFMDGIGAAADTVIVTDPDYLMALGKILDKSSPEAIRDYLKWTHLNGAADFLSTDIERANFDFYGKVLNGTEEMRPRWERVLNVANWTIGEPIGKLYVEGYFPPEAKATAMEMVDNIKAAFADRIKQLEWMSEDTKQKALKKLSTFRVKIAYPDEWEDFSDLEVQSAEEGGSYVSNLIAVTEREWRKDLQDIGQPVDKDEWFMAPQIVNAYYNPSNNEIVFPAAIMQPPFFYYNADPAINYGGIGAVIGHEISHGFDDQGSRYDEKGNLVNWWTDEDRTRFEERTKLLADQYDAYSPLEGVHVNGNFTMGENIGDLGGVNVAYAALQKHLDEHGDPGLIDGYTQNQRFFLSWGTIWRTKYRDEALKSKINTDPHSPGMYRAIGPISNMPEFYEAFNVSEQSALYRPDSLRVKIW